MAGSWGKKRNRRNKLISLFLVVVLLAFASPGIWAATESEVPEAVYSGTELASMILYNIDYTDVKNTNTWAAEAIYETGAMNLMKGYGNRLFGLGNSLSREQAIAVAYRIAGREGEIPKAEQKLATARSKAGSKIVTLPGWSDGYLQQALDDGLITQVDYDNAFSQSTTGAAAKTAFRTSPAQRQEMAFWVAKALNLTPIFDQQRKIDGYSDAKVADPAKLPYIEAILRNNIMNGTASGYFSPTGIITREQAAQIIKNAREFMLPLIGLKRKMGTIEAISTVTDYSNGKTITRDTLQIRNSNGKLHQIQVEFQNEPQTPGKNEQDGQPLPQPEKELVVYKDEQIGNSRALRQGDRIEYFPDVNNGVTYVKTISSIYDTQYIAAQILKVDTSKATLDVLQFFNVTLPEIELIEDRIDFSLLGNSVNQTYTYSSNAAVQIDGYTSTVNKLLPDMYVVLTVSNSVITGVRTFAVDDSLPEEGSIVQGIVEDNNPFLGYISLYNEDGTGVSPEYQGQMIMTRVFTYLKPDSLEVYKNHEKTYIEDVEPGDSVFMKLDEMGHVVAISAVDNYRIKYASVLSKKPTYLVVSYEDNTQQVLDIAQNLPVFLDGRVVGYSTLKEGDRIKLLLNITPQQTRVKEIEIEGKEHFIANIYKGKVDSIDTISNKLIVQNLESLYNGNWQVTEQKGFTGIKLSAEVQMNEGSQKMDAAKVNKYYKGKEAYIAVEKDYNGTEKAVRVSFKNMDDAEKLYDDNISSMTFLGSEFGLNKASLKIKYTDGTIIVKDNRLVTGNSIAVEDLAYIVANRSYADGLFYAGVVQIAERAGMNLPDIYRARIRQINENKDFTVESFARLKGLQWEYSNTPKTFILDRNTTSIMNDQGVVNLRDFVDYGTGSYAGQTVYIVSNDIDTLLVSTAPYGVYNVRGEVYEVAGAVYGEEGTLVGQPTGIKIKGVKVYDEDNFLWKDGNEMNLNLLNTTVIMKDGRLVKPSELKKSDKVRVIRKDAADTGDAYIVIVES